VGGQKNLDNQWFRVKVKISKKSISWMKTLHLFFKKDSRQELSSLPPDLLRIKFANAN